MKKQYRKKTDYDYIVTPEFTNKGFVIYKKPEKKGKKRHEPIAHVNQDIFLRRFEEVRR